MIPLDRLFTTQAGFLAALSRFHGQKATSGNRGMPKLLTFAQN